MVRQERWEEKEMTETKLFLDDKHNVVPPEKATWLVVMDYDKEDKLRGEKWVSLKKKPSKTKKGGDLTDERLIKSVEIRFLGTGAKTKWKEQVKNKKGNPRKYTSTLINNKVLINATSDHVDWIKQNAGKLKGVIFSHAHKDAMDREAITYLGDAPIFITEALLTAANKLRGITLRQLNIKTVKTGETFKCEGIEFILVEVNHAENTPAYAIVINGTTVHSEDIYRFKDNDILGDESVKLWITDGSLFDRDIMKAHMSMKKAIQLATKHKIETVIFTQIGHNKGLSHKELQILCSEYASDLGKVRVEIATEDEEVTLKDQTFPIQKISFISPNKPKYRFFKPEEIKELEQFEYPLLVQKKYDGFQAQIHAIGGKGICNAKIYSGRGKQKTKQFNIACVQALSALPENTVVDSEAYMYKDSQPLHRSMIIGYADSTKYDEDKDSRSVFEIYDVLTWKGEDVRDKLLSERLKLLAQIKQTKNIKVMKGKDQVTVNSYSELASAIQKVSNMKGSEGAMIKVLSAPYTKDVQNKYWGKIKKTFEVDCLVTKKKEQKPGVFNYYVVAGPLDSKCADVYRRDKPDDLRNIAGKPFAFLGGTFNTSIQASKGDIIRIETLEVNKREILNKEKNPTGCYTYGLFHPKVLSNITDIRSSPDNISVLDHIARFTLPIEKTSQEQLETHYQEVVKAGEPLPSEFYKWKPKKKQLRWLIHEHKPGKKTEEGREQETTALGEEHKPPAHGERGSKKRIILKFRDHLDFRLEIGEDNVAWTGFTPHPPQEPTVWDVFKQRMKQHRQVQCSAKSPCTHPKCMEWFKIGKGKWDEIPVGEAGATTIRTGLLKIMDEGTYTPGVQRGNMHEYFLKGNIIKGRVVFRRLNIGGKTNWYFIYPEDQMPLKPWEHEDSGEWQIKGAEAPLKKTHVKTDFDPDRFIRLFDKEMQLVLNAFKSNKLTKQEALLKARELIAEFVVRATESSKRRLTKHIKKDIDKLPSELMKRIERTAQGYLEDFKEILDDVKP